MVGMKVSAGGPAAHDAAIDEAEQVRDVGRRLEVMGRMQDGGPAIAQLPQQVDDQLLGRLVDAGHRLIQQQDRCLLHQRARQEDALLLPPRQGADLGSAEVGQRHPFERLADRRPVPGAGHAQPADAWVASHHHHLLRADREAPVDRLPLRHIGEPVSLLGDGAAIQQHRAGLLRGQPQDRLQQRALARSVRPDHADQGAGRNSEIHVLQDRTVTIAGADAVQDQSGLRTSHLNMIPSLACASLCAWTAPSWPPPIASAPRGNGSPASDSWSLTRSPALAAK
jgi:hypothetical protein